MIEKVLPYAADGIWLDVGFGNGALLFTAQEYGFTSVGVDVRIENVNIMNALGVESYHTDLAHLSLATKCSVISMCDVLEHIPYPKPALSAARRLLKDGGVLLVSMPNSESMTWRISDMQNANPYWNEINHYHNFSRTRLYSMLNEHGFTPARYGISNRYLSCMEVVAVARAESTIGLASI